MRRIALATLVVVSLLAAASALFFLLRPSRGKSADIEASLETIDSAIAGGYLGTARAALEGMRALPSDEGDLLRVLKRAFEVSRATGDYRLMSAIGEKATAAGGSSPHVRALAAYAFLRADRRALAEKTLARGGLPHEIEGFLAGEQILRRGGAWAGANALTRDLLSLERNTDPGAYTSAALRIGDARLSLDAALLHIQAGNPGKAQTIAQEDLRDAAFDEPAAAIAWDAGDFPTAIERLSRLAAARPERAEAALLLADVSQALGRTAAAEKALARVLPLAPQLSWTPYANLAFFAGLRGEWGLALRRLEDGRAFFPQSRELRLAQAQAARRSGDMASAMKILSGLVADRPDDGEAALSQLEILAPGMSPEQYRARLWKLFNLIPADAATFTALSALLVGGHDWEGAAAALTQHEAAGGIADDGVFLIRGIIAAMRGDDAAAEEAFRRADAIARDGTARYNLALVLLRRGNARAAIAEVRRAMDEFELRGRGGERARVLSLMEMLTGSARLLEGDETGARAAFGRSLALDARNLRAGLLLRKLEAGEQ